MYNVTYNILPAPKPTPIQIWSCDPKDIIPWTLKDKFRLIAVLSRAYGWAPRLVSYAFNVDECPPLPNPIINPVAQLLNLKSIGSSEIQFQQDYLQYTWRTND